MNMNVGSRGYRMIAWLLGIVWPLNCVALLFGMNAIRNRVTCLIELLS